MTTPSSEPDPRAAGDGHLDQLFALNRLLVQRASAATTDEGDAAVVSPVPGAPPAVPAVSAEIANANEHFNVFTAQARELESSIARNETVTSDQIGNLLDNARAWVDYFGPDGPLWRGFPPSVSPQVYVDAHARVSQLQRVAQQWVDYLQPLWEKGASVSQDRARQEEDCLRQVSQAEATVRQRQVSFSLNSASLSPAQMQSYIQELNDILATAQGWAATAPTAACSQRIQQLIAQIANVQSTFDFTLRSRSAYGGPLPGALPPSGWSAGSGRPGPGSPEWFQGITGMNCYWCGQSLTGLPAPVVVCPNCGRFPEPQL